MEFPSSRTVILVLTVAVLFLFFRHALFATALPGVMAQVLAALLMLWARLTFGLRSFHGAADPTAGGLVTRGPYRWLRHPIYAAILLFVWAGVASHPTLANAAAGVVATVASIARMLAEERLLVVRYPEYTAYAARTKRVIPFVL